MSVPLKVGLNLVFIRPECLVEVAQAAEALGFDSLWMGEHVALPSEGQWWRGYPSNPASDADMTFRPENEWLDPLAVFAHLAAATKTIRFGVGIYMLALRNPVIVARTLATIDVLSRGRLTLGVGLGWSPVEYAITESDFSKRGRRTDESIRCLRALFDPAQPFPEFHGEFFEVPKIGFQPKPAQSPFPIHVGGYSPAAVRRAALLGDGYYGSPDYIPAIRAALAEAGRDDANFEFSNSVRTEAETNPDHLHDLAEQGVHRAIVQPWKHHVPMGLEAIDRAERFAREIGLQPT